MNASDLYDDRTPRIDVNGPLLLAGHERLASMLDVETSLVAPRQVEHSATMKPEAALMRTRESNDNTLNMD